MNDLLEEFLTITIEYINNHFGTSFDWNYIPEKKGYIILQNGKDIDHGAEPTNELENILKQHLPLYGFEYYVMGLIKPMKGD